MIDPATYPRDMVGYGRDPLDPQWPGNARIAVQFVVNYEEGGENSILHGDPHSESYLTEVVGTPPLADERNLTVESMYEYGSRAGFWRLLRLFDERGLPFTTYAVAMALARNPEAAQALIESDHEVASHGWRWIDYRGVPEEIEREHVRLAVETIAEVCGVRPHQRQHKAVGGRGGWISLRRRRL